MANGLQSTWSTTAASNATADDTINLREGQSPGSLNDAVRGVMAGVATYRADISGALVTTGSSTVYALTTVEGITASVAGMRISASMHVTNGTNATLNVDGTGALAIHSSLNTPALPGLLLEGAVYDFAYVSGVWRVAGSFDASQLVSSASEATAGKVLLASTSEATTGTNTTKAVTPAGLKAAVDVLKNGVSAAYDTLAELAAGLAAVQALIPSAASQAEMEAASSNTVWATPGRLKNHPGVAKAWFNYNLATQTVVASYGVTSITRTGTGLFTVTFSTAFSDTTYAMVGSARYTGAVGSAIASSITGATKTTTQMALEAASGAGLFDSTEVSCAFFGDQ